MTFIALMAVRELRASWRRLAFFFVCIAIGVGAIVSLRSVIQNVRGALTRETRALIASDILVTSNAPFDDETRALVAAERAAGRVTAVSEALEIATMVRPAARASAVTKMVELRAVQPSFPYYGTLTLQEGPYRHELLAGRGVLVRPELLAQLDLHVGDRLLIGTQEFEIRGVISGEPGRNLGTFSLGPRVLIDYADLESTGLLGFGSRSTRQMLIKAPASTARVVADRLTDALRNKFVRARGYWQNEDRIGENLSRAENYLSLVGLVILILGGIGVSSVTPGLRAAEGPQHRHPEVPGRFVADGVGGLPRPGRPARAGGEPPGRGPGLGCRLVGAVRARRRQPAGGGLRPQRVGGVAGAGGGPARLTALRRGAAPRRAAGEAVAAPAARGIRCPRCGLGEVGRGRGRGRRAGGGGRLAGGVVTAWACCCRPDSS